MVKIFCLLGAINACIAIIAGAFGAHGLKKVLSPEYMTAFTTGANYHFYHALGLFVVAFAYTQFPDNQWVKWSGVMMQVGILLFSGSLYVLSVTSIRGMGIVTPFGGVAFILAWVFLAIAVARS